MPKSRMYLLLGASTILLLVPVLLLLSAPTTLELLVVTVAMLLTSVVPLVLINRLVSEHARQLQASNAEHKALESEMASMRSRMEQITTLDELTGCYNERHFLDLVAQHRAMAERGKYQFTVAIAQVDQFGEIIENQGLGRGNEVLQLFSRIVKAALREADALARLEADKFGLLLSGCGEEDALNIINRISQLIGQIQVTEADDIKITASGGLTEFHGTESAEDLMVHAGEALAFAVEQGRDHVAGYLYQAPEASAN
ncbi:MAG: GGDEF domain-containing protein [Pseudomonadota bacterium]